jgi:hypothetical protein
MNKYLHLLWACLVVIVGAPAQATIGDLGPAIASDLEGFFRVDIGPYAPGEDPPCDTIYASAAAATNWATVLARYDAGDTVVCFDPDDYSGFGEFTPDNGDSGASRADPNFLFCTQGQDPFNETEPNRCKIDSVQFNNVDNWAILGFDIDNDGDVNNTVTVSQDSDNVFIVANWIHDSGRHLMSVGRGSDGMVIQSNVVCEGPLVGEFDEERHAIFLAAGSGEIAAWRGMQDLLITDNVFCNFPGDGLHFHPSPAGGGDPLDAGANFNGLRVLANECYITDTRYRDGAGNYDVNGDFMAAENCFDTKVTIPFGDAPTEAEKTIFAYNILHGLRKTDSEHLTMSSHGTAAIFQFDDSSWIYYLGNVTYNSVAGLAFENRHTNVEMNRNAFLNVAIQDEQTRGVFAPIGSNTGVGMTFNDNWSFSEDAACATNNGVPPWLKAGQCDGCSTRLASLTGNYFVNGCNIEPSNFGGLNAVICGDNFYWGNGTTGSPQGNQAILEDEPGRDADFICGGVEDINDNTVPAAQDFTFDIFRKTNRTPVTVTGAFLGHDTAPTVDP